MALELKNLAELRDRVGFVLVSATSTFPRVGPFSDLHDRNLVVAFESLESGMWLVEGAIDDPAQLARLRQLLRDSLAAFRSKQLAVGARLLQEFDAVVFPDQFKKRGSSRGPT